MSVITIDSGTTNTRVRLWQSGRLVAAASEVVGLRDAATTGSGEVLSAGIKNALRRTLTQAPDYAIRLCRLVASGMLTADTGLCPLPYLPALDDQARAARCRIIPALSDQPVWFIPGFKTATAISASITSTSRMQCAAKRWKPSARSFCLSCANGRCLFCPARTPNLSASTNSSASQAAAPAWLASCWPGRSPPFTAGTNLVEEERPFSGSGALAAYH